MGFIHVQAHLDVTKPRPTPRAIGHKVSEVSKLNNEERNESIKGSTKSVTGVGKNNTVTSQVKSGYEKSSQ